jgi:predicted dehydrogenase
LGSIKKVRAAVVGLGKMGILHSAVVNMIPGAELVAVADINKQLSRYVEQSGLKAPFYADVDRMLEEIKPDAAFLCTPAFANRSVAERCLGAGLDVFIEKPLAHTFEDAKIMAALASNRDIIHATGYLFAHMSLFKKAKEVLSDGAIGRPYRVRSSVYTSEVFTRKKGWYYDREKSGGGVVINVGSHLLYVLYWFFGQAENVYARARRVYSEVEDAATILFGFPEEVTGTMDVSWSVPGYRLPYTEIHIEGDNGTLELTNDYIKLYLYKASGAYAKEWTTIHKIDLPSGSRFELGAEGLYEEDEDFIRSSAGRTKPAVTWADGLEIQRMIEAIYRSVDHEEAVSLREIR